MLSTVHIWSRVRLALKNPLETPMLRTSPRSTHSSMAFQVAVYGTSMTEYSSESGSLAQG
jgi:hypothetical protein